MRKRCVYAIVALVSFGWTGTIRSQGLFGEAQETTTLEGFIRTELFLGKTPENDELYLQSIYGQAGILLDATAGGLASAGAELRFRYGNAFQEPVKEFEIRELYVELDAGPAGFIAGKRIDPWGKGTLFNPSGKITPMDPTVRSSEEDDVYLGVWSLQGYLDLGRFMKFSAIWKPLYRSSVLLVDPIPLPAYVSFQEPEKPGMELDRGSFGVRYDLHTGLLDGSLYGFGGYSHWPGIAFGSFSVDTVQMVPAALNLVEKPYRIRMAAMDLSIPLGSWIFRAEGAWQRALDERNRHEYIPYPELSYTGEIEWAAGRNTLVGGYYGKYILDYEEPTAEPSLIPGEDLFTPGMHQGDPVPAGQPDEMIRARIGAFNRLYNYQIERVYHTAFILWNRNFLHDQLKISLPVIYHVTSSEWLISPKIEWVPADGLRIAAGYQEFFGDDNALYDLIGPVLNAGYLSVKVSF